jgi:protocatechuate 3,4-dioxygenase beta subunit
VSNERLIRCRVWLAVLVMVVLALPACDGGSDDGEEQSTSGAPGGSAGTDRGTATASGFPKPAECRPGADPTPEQTEGPFYKADPPRRTSLVERGVTGRRLLLRGRVLSTDCRTLAEARVDFWQAGGDGEYDNEGYRLRGYQLTDGQGRYRLETVVPSQYDGRTAHIHVKITPRGGETLTTQLYFPGKAENRSDAIFDPATLLRVRRGSDAWRAAFDFVVEPG